MIHPLNDSESSSFRDVPVSYQITAWECTLPAFDPVPMTKTVLLSPDSVKVYNRVAVKLQPLLHHFVHIGLVLRFAAFATPAQIGRILAPISVFFHMFGLFMTTAQMRTEYVKILLHTFDFWFLQAANTLWGIIFSIVLQDLRVVLVFFCWADFACWLLQETYLRNSYAVVMVAFYELVFYVLLTIALILDFVDDVQHYELITTSRGHSLSTKDVLINVLGTMATISLRNLFCRYQHVKYQKSKSGTAMPALGYRCKIALTSAGPMMSTARSNIVPQNDNHRNQEVQTTFAADLPPLKMQLVVDSERFDPRNTVWKPIGELSPIASWKIYILYVCGAMGGVFALVSLMLPENFYGAELIAVSGVIISGFFTLVFLSCCQRQLLKRVMTSFHFLFLWFQIVAIGLCVNDLYGWQWVPACGVICSLLLSYTILTVDALTPIMKQRLRFSYWIFINSIALYLTTQTLLLIDVLLLGDGDLQDRVFLSFNMFGRRVQFRVAPLFFSRVITVFVWAGRYVYVALTRPDDSALILLRGNVEFDYEGWKKARGRS